MAKGHKTYPKVPKKPKSGAPLETLRRYNQRLTDWNKQCAEVDAYNKQYDAENNKATKGLQQARSRRTRSRA